MLDGEADSWRQSTGGVEIDTRRRSRTVVVVVGVIVVAMVVLTAVEKG